MKHLVKNSLLRLGVFHDLKEVMRGRNVEMERFYGSFLKPGELVFDVGANVGGRTKIFSRIGCTVVAVEPHRECARNLAARFRFRRNVRIEPVAISEREGQATFFESDLLTVSTLSPDFIKFQEKDGLDGKWHGGVPVATATLDSLIAKHGLPAFIKVDVEGIEINVLRGLHIAVPHLSYEYHPKLMDATRECLDRLNEISPRYRYNYCVGETPRFALDEYEPFNEFVKRLPGMARDQLAYGDIYARLPGGH